MSYTALYRKYRPSSFSEMVGQEHITKTLRNQIISQRVGHAYLFNGGRGTGKTSAAKILARAVNCLNPKDGEPCNECEICKAAISGSLTDIVEMDAASNNSVEDIRTIREEVNFLPTLAKYRVYIIDEVHMLSTGAFNALLKTLEEPPEHVKFILATTEPQKLPATILSRCQRFDFKKISPENIVKRLKIICEDGKIDITEEALNIISILAEGAMRDALSILERCMQDGDNKIDEDKVKDLIGIPKFDAVNEITKNIIEYNIEDSLNSINKILSDGKDLNNIIWEIIKYLKDLLLYKTTENKGLYSENEVIKMSELSVVVSKERLVSLINELSKLENEIKWSSQKTIVFQAGIIKLCAKTDTDGLEDLRRKVQQLEEKLESGKFTVNQNSVKNDFSNEMKPVNKVQRPNLGTSNNKINTANLKSESYWPQIINEFKAEGKIMLYTNLINTRAKELNDMVVGIEFPNGLTSFGKTVLEKTENMNEIIKKVSIACGKEMRIKLLDNNSKQNTNDNNNIENLAKDMDLPINIIEE